MAGMGSLLLAATGHPYACVFAGLDWSEDSEDEEDETERPLPSGCTLRLRERCLQDW